MEKEQNRNLPVIDILNGSWQYFKENKKIVALFSVVNFLFLSLGFDIIGGWSNPVFLVWTLFYYIFWVYFFRYFFDRKPYLLLNVKLVDSLVPSTKILFISFLVMTILAVLPFIPLFIFPQDMVMVEKYEAFLKKYMEDSQLMNMVLAFAVLVFSPIIFYRPFMAWISSIIGRSGAIKTAWAKTENNHWRIVFIVLVLNIPFSVLYQMELMWEVPKILIWFLSSPFVIYFNVVVAKSYEFFYLNEV